MARAIALFLPDIIVYKPIGNLPVYYDLCDFVLKFEVYTSMFSVLHNQQGQVKLARLDTEATAQG